MPKVTCTCGYVFDLSKEGDYSFTLIPESDIEAAVLAANAFPLDGDGLTDIIDEHSKNVLICPVCRTLYLESETNLYQRHVRED